MNYSMKDDYSEVTLPIFVHEFSRLSLIQVKELVDKNGAHPPDTSSEGFNLIIPNKDDNINSKPVHANWSIDKKSQLIESFLMNMPVPQVFLYSVIHGNYKVIDGLNRIAAIADFYNNAFALSKLEVLQKYNGAYYKDLPTPVRRTLDRRSLKVDSLLVHYSLDGHPTDDYLARLLKIAQKRLQS